MIRLTPDFLMQFAQEQSWTERAKVIERVATAYAEDAYEEAEYRAAQDLFRIALYDGETVVRRVLAESLKHARDLPRDVVRRLAQDVPEVSAPFLAASPLLGDEELMPIAKCGATEQRKAIAGRPRLSKRVATVLHRAEVA